KPNDRPDDTSRPTRGARMCMGAITRQGSVQEREGGKEMGDSDKECRGYIDEFHKRTSM
ncbi:hypothetical protein SISNIDRAFT_458586, partial [Sistotremastrum niveocremeum HHB9708]